MNGSNCGFQRGKPVVKLDLQQRAEQQLHASIQDMAPQVLLQHLLTPKTGAKPA